MVPQLRLALVISVAGFSNLCEVGKARIRAVAKDIASKFDCTKIVQGGGYEGFRAV